MAYDGITISALCEELKDKIIGGRVDKVYQPESDEIILGIRSFGSVYKLLLSANPSNPKFHFTDKTKDNPLNPPLFCMVLRKHIQSGKIIEVTQPDFDRILNIKIEALNEMGDYTVKTLILEIMGRHSNLILIDENDTVLDCAKHITHEKSSVREVLPGKAYAMPPNQTKISPLELNEENFEKALENFKSQKAQNVIYKSYNGISPIVAGEICFRSGIDPSDNVESLDDSARRSLFYGFQNIVEKIKNKEYHPHIIYNETGGIIDFSVLTMLQFKDNPKKDFDTTSQLVETFYQKRDFSYRINQKTQDLKHLISQNIDRCVRKYDMQQQTLKDIENRDELRLCGELLTANIYAVKKGMTTVKLPNFYSENYEEVEISLDGNLTPAENAQKYFKKYNKAKRTYVALQEQIVSNKEELEYLEGVLTSVENCVDEQDVKEIRSELFESGYVKKAKAEKGKKNRKKSKPLHFISSDGFDIYVGKNNIQNDMLTLKIAKSNDIWMHTKNIPGSHVIVCAQREREISDATLNEAANLAAYYSKARESTLVPVDYTEKRNVKKPNGAKPGFVIYETNKTAYITPSEDGVNALKAVND